MARSRTLHPTFFTNHDLVGAEQATALPLRVAYSGLWCHADRCGRFEWNPARLKLGILPYDACDMGAVLEALEVAQFVQRYVVGGREYGIIPTFLTHQRPHPREAPSKYPAPPRRALGKPRRGRGNAKSVGLSSPSSLRTLKPSDSRPATPRPDQGFTAFWDAYPKRPNNSRTKAHRVWLARLAEHVDPAAMVGGAKAYAAYVQRSGIAPKFVKLAATFLGPDRHWEADYGVEAEGTVRVYDERGEMTQEFANAMGLTR